MNAKARQSPASLTRPLPGGAPILLALLICGLGTLSSSEAQLVVTLEEGQVRGHARQTVYGFPYVGFLGIPYAEPPIGALRFKEAVPKAAWEGVLDAEVEGSPCPQFNNSGVYVGVEDCLFLNVYTPQLPEGDAELRKVMVWIHGGGFLNGDGGPTQFGPDFLIQRGVLLVALNYRLGALGFLNLENDLVPGNLGLRDQNLALQWVRRNVRAFGGDPDDVTIFGESAGAASVHYHLLSNSSRGLFTRAIAQSGCALNPWALSTTPRQRAFSLAAVLGLSGEPTDQQVLDFLSQAPADELVLHGNDALSDKDSRRLMEPAFVPSVEPDLPGAFLTQEPAVLVAEGRYTKVPYLTGVNSEECNMFVSVAINGPLSTNESLVTFDEDFEAVIGPSLRLKDEYEQNTTARVLRNFYYGDEAITTALATNTTNLLTDLFFEEGVETVVRKMAEDSSQTLHFYRFSFKGPISRTTDRPGVTHTEDLRYIFRTSVFNQNLDPESEEGVTRDRLVDMWTNFAKYGDPTPNVTSLLTTPWEAYTETTPYFFNINGTLRLESAMDQERMDLWHSLLPPSV